MTVFAARESLLASLSKWLERWIRRHIIAEGYQDEDGFHYLDPRWR